MSCFHPLDGYRVKGGTVTVVARGDRPPVKAITRVPFTIPCGRCIGCRMEKARQWGLRCMHEKKLWLHSCYVTLTYENEYLPPGGTLVVRDLQLFMKRLRKAKNSGPDNPLRFFAGGEYGEVNKRPHYHLLLFNCHFPDMRLHSNNMRGEPLYTSEELRSLWFQGHSTIGEVTFDSAVYCAKYALKKVTGDAAYEHYQVFDEDGVVYDRLPEFALMSRRPGIGSGYYEKFGKEVRDHDSVVVNGREVRPPRFYDRRTERLCKEAHDQLTLRCKCRFCEIKRDRLRAVNRADNTEERLRVKERIATIAADKKERKL